jgi:hypothetical protein
MGPPLRNTFILTQHSFRVFTPIYLQLVRCPGSTIDRSTRAEDYHGFIKPFKTTVETVQVRSWWHYLTTNTIQCSPPYIFSTLRGLRFCQRLEINYNRKILKNILKITFRLLLGLRSVHFPSRFRTTLICDVYVTYPSRLIFLHSSSANYSQVNSKG